MKKRFTDAEIVTMLRSADSRQQELAITDLYERLGDTIIRLVKRHKGSQEDGEEVISDALCALLTNARSGAFAVKPDVKLSTYVYTLAKFTWLKRLRKENLWLGTQISIDHSWPGELPQEDTIADERQDLFWELVNRLAGKCRTLLEAVVAGFSMQEIALMLELGNADNAKAHKYNCMKKIAALRMNQL